MKRRAFSLVGIFLALTVWHRSHFRKTPPLAETFLERSKHESQEKIHHALEDALRVSQKSAGPGVPNAAWNRALKHFAESRFSIHREEERRELLERMADDPLAVAWTARYLQNLDLARSQYGNGHADARLYGIQLLRTAAEKGMTEPLEQTTQTVARELRAEPHHDAGRARDLEELVEAMVFVKKDSALDKMDLILRDLGYDPSLEREFVTGIYLGLKDTYDKNIIIERLRAVGIDVFRRSDG